MSHYKRLKPTNENRICRITKKTKLAFSTKIILKILIKTRKKPSRNSSRLTHHFPAKNVIRFNCIITKQRVTKAKPKIFIQASREKNPLLETREAKRRDILILLAPNR